MGLAGVFVDAGSEFGVGEAQIAFAKAEFKRQLDFRRKPLGDVKTIRQLLGESYETPLPALFFNLWQNSPGGAYKLFLRAYRNAEGDVGRYFDLAWMYLNHSGYADWGWKSKQYLASIDKNPKKPNYPRIVRIKKAIKEFYGVDLAYYK